MYKQGLNIRDKIFDGYPHFEGEYGIALDKWNNLNISVNFIGEAKNLKETIKSLRKVGFSSKSLILFTHQSQLYGVMFDNIIIEKKFSYQLKENVSDVAEVINYDLSKD
jgi:1-aminocyclopropane-1-carboxylate deaminase/D-cysteine desulfhydrase-like pyridoxal-dependent ACC family enzyme